MIAVHTTLRHTTAAVSPSLPHPNPGLEFRRKIVYLETRLNVDSHKALTLNPDFRSAPISAVKSVEACLSSMGLSLPDRGRVLDMHPRLLTADPDLHLYPVLDFLLHEAGLPFPSIRRALVRCPRLLLCDVAGQLRPALRFLADLGFPSALDPRTAPLLVSNVDHTLRPKLEYIRLRLGVSSAAAAQMAVRAPGILTLSVEGNLAPKAEYFLGEMKGDAAELRRFPQYFSFSLERKIQPRHRALTAAGFSVPLADMLKVSDGEFSARLVEMRLRTVDELSERNWDF